MDRPFVLGLDTSNYTTSAARYEPESSTVCHRRKLLPVREGELGLRQSDALFHHVRQLPEVLDSLPLGEARPLAVCASDRPRSLPDSYMPCFLAGEGQGRGIASALGVPFYAHSHQQGHLAAAAWSAGRLDLLDRPFLAWHLSGGTTELLLVRPEGTSVAAEIIGGTSDISAGKLIDRAGVLMGLPFPAGKALDALAQEGSGGASYQVRLDGLRFSLSGMENKVKQLWEAGEEPTNIARFTLNTIVSVVLRATQAAQEEYPGLPVLCSGGVASNSQLRRALEDHRGALFSQPRYATDNAMGTAILTWRARRAGEEPA